MMFQKINLANFPDYIFNENVLIPAAIILLIIWLIYRIKRRIKLAIAKAVYTEIYKHFPVIKKEMENFEYRINFLNNLTNSLERRINELESYAKRYTSDNADIKKDIDKKT